MKIGLTYDLKADYLALGWSKEDVAEFDGEETIAGIETALRALGHETDRIGRCVELARRLVRGDRWDLVFNIAEGAHGRGREAQVPALLEAFDVPCAFCDSLTAALTLDKAMAKRVVRDAGLRTPDFALVESPEDIAGVRLAFPLFAKPNAEGTGKGVDAASVIRDAAGLHQVCVRLLERYRQPALVERFLPGREVTVGIVGTGRAARVIGLMEVMLLDKAEREVYSYVNKAYWEDRVRYRLVEEGTFRDEAAALALACYRVLGCRDAGRVDIRADEEGRPSFIEVNPLAGINEEYSDLPILNRMVGRTYHELIAEIVASAMTRVPARGS